MTHGEAFEVFLSILDLNGFAAVTTDTSIKIIPKANVRTSGIALTNSDLIGPGDGYIVKVLKVKHVSVAQLAEIAKPMIGEEGYMAAYSQANSLILIGRSGSIRELAKLINELDRPGSIDIDMIKVEFASAKEVSEIVRGLVQGSAESSGGVKIAVDDRSNSLFVTGDPFARQQIKSLVAKLDTPLSGGGNTQVVHLSYATASKVLPILSGVSGSEQENKKDSADKSMAVSIQADDSLNAVIITAPPSILSTLKGVIAQLDVRRGQVMVEAIIAEVNEDMSDRFGIEWKVPLKDSTGTAGGFSGYPSGLTPLSVNNGRVQLGTALSLGYLVDMDIRALINVLRGQSDANILSTPRIMALDNEEAQILLGENVPFVTGSQQRPGDLQPFQTIQRQDIGISLKIVPKINNENSVTLEIEQKVESIGNSDVQTADIITNKREIKTRVIVDNGQMLVLGGLMRDEAQLSESKVPVLSRLPLLGRLFRSTVSSTVKRNLLVFIRPTILPDGQSSNELSRQQYDIIVERQERFNRNSDLPTFPRLKPGPTMSEFPGNEGGVDQQ